MTVWKREPVWPFGMMSEGDMTRFIQGEDRAQQHFFPYVSMITSPTIIRRGRSMRTPTNWIFGILTRPSPRILVD